MTQTVLQIPEALKPADGRFGSGPSRVRPAQLEHLAGPGAAIMGTSHRQKPVKRAGRAGARRPGRAVLAARRLRDRARQRRHHRLLGCRRLRSDPRALAAPGLRRVLGQVRRLQATARRSWPTRSSSRAEPGARPSRRADPAADVIAWAHNETSTGVMVPVARPADAGDALVLIDATSGAGGLPRRRGRGRRLLLRPAEGLCLRRRPVAGRCSAPRARADRARLDADAGRPLDPRLPLARDGARELAQGPDLQHAGAGDAAAARRPARLDARAGRPRRDGRAHHESSGHLYGWAEPAPHATPFVADPAEALAGRRHDRLRRRRSTPPRSRRRCAPTGSSTSSRTASWAATSCGWRCSRPPTRRRPGAHRVHRLGAGAAHERARCWWPRRSATPGIELLREHFEVEIGAGWSREELGERIGEYDGILIRSATS